MKFKYSKGVEIQGNLDIKVVENEDEFDGAKTTWKEIQIHGDPEGLKSFAKLILEMAELNQEEVETKYLPTGAREHYHLRPGLELSKSSFQTIVGRLDAKGTKEFYSGYIPKDEI